MRTIQTILFILGLIGLFTVTSTSEAVDVKDLDQTYNTFTNTFDYVLRDAYVKALTGWTKSGTNVYLTTLTDKVGIGTTSPNAPLEVAGDGEPIIRVSDSGDSNKLRATIGESNNQGGYLNLYNNAEVSKALIRSYTVSDVQAYFTAGNIGIGTAVPTKKLHVYSPTGTGLLVESNAGDASVQIDSGGGSYDSQLFFMDDGSYRWMQKYDSTSGQLKFYSYVLGDYTMVMATDGKVGIGTTAPVTKLHIVKSDLTSEGSNSGDALTIENDGHANLNLIGNTTLTSGLLFSDTTRAVGYIRYNHGDYGAGANKMEFATNGGTTQMVIDGDGNVGIGTTGPAKKLQVNVDTSDTSDRVALMLRNTNAHNQVRLQLSVLGDAATSVNSGMQLFHTTDAGSGAGWANYEARPLSFWTGTSAGSASQQMTITTSGNVGIGTTAPGEKLDVNGNIKLAVPTWASEAGNRTIGLSNTWNLGWGQLDESVGIVGIGGNVAYISGDETSSTRGLVFKNQSDVINFAQNFGTGNTYIRGKVGIGTTAPGWGLEIAGTDQDRLGITVAENANDYADAQVMLRRSRGTLASPAVVQDNDEIGSVRFRGHDGTDWEDAARIVALVDGTPAGSATDMPGRLEFQTSPDGDDDPITRLAITNNGNVGIGTTAPDKKMVVATATDGDGIQLVDSADSNNQRALLGYADTLGGALILTDEDESNTAVIRSYAIDNVQAYFTAGNVGIGTTAPQVKLQVAGTTDVGTGWDFASFDAHDGYLAITGEDSYLDIVSNDAGTIGSIITLKQVDGTVYENAWGIYRQTNGNGLGDGSLRFSYGTDDLASLNDDMMTILPSGNVGIGTTNPQASLDIVSDDAEGLRVRRNIDSNNVVALRLGVDDAYYKSAIYHDRQTSTNGIGNLVFSVDSNDDASNIAIADAKMTILSTGYVGIGKTSPGSPLEVVGDHVANQGILYVNANSGQPAFIGMNAGSVDKNSGIILRENGATKWIIRNTGAESDKLQIEDDGDIRLTIQQDGNVGIGTTAPTEELEVIGSISASNTVSGIVVDTQYIENSSDGYITFRDGMAVFSSKELSETPVQGAIEFANDRFYITNVANQRAIDRTSDVATETVTVSNTTTETIVYTGSLAAGSLKVGNVLKLYMSGEIDEAAAADICTIRVKVGGVEFASIESPGTGTANQCWHVVGEATIRAVGETGSMAWHLDIVAGGTSDAVCNVDTIDTTTSEDVTVTAQWNNAKEGNIFLLTQGFMEFKN